MVSPPTTTAIGSSLAASVVTSDATSFAYTTQRALSCERTAGVQFANALQMMG